MKKISLLLIAIFASFSFLFTGCSTSNVIRLNEVTHSIFYAPLYVAINNGYFKDEGLTIQLTNGGGSDASMTALLSNSVDIALVGPETVVYVNSQGRQNAPVIFGQLTKRDGYFLVGRTDEIGFDWSNLAGKHIIAGRRGGSPAMSLQYALEQNGYDITNDLTFDLSIAFNMTAGAFEGGTGDYVTMFEPLASEYVKAGKGYIVASVGSESGEIPFTCFVANQSFLTNNAAKAQKFLRAVVRGYNFLMESSIYDAVIALAPSFVGTSTESIAASVTSYKNIDAWVDDPAMKIEAFNRLQDIMENAGELDNRVDFADVVDNTIATAVMASI